MRTVRIVTDSTADMDEAAADRLGVVVVPLNVHWNGDTYQDKVDITADQFYRMLREDKGTPRTSQPSVGIFEDVYRRLLDQSEGVISVHISGSLSGTVNSARVAAGNVDPGRIAVMDTLSIATPQGWVALRLAQMAWEGASLDDCRAEAEKLIPRTRLICAFDTLEFLRRGGRIGRVQAFAGSLLSIKPIIHLVDGEIIPLDRVRTRAAAIRRVAELARGLGELDRVAVLFADDPQPSEQLISLLRDCFPRLEIGRGRIGPVVGTHVGPGAFGACGIVRPES